jgi:hypothetical protein
MKKRALVVVLLCVLGVAAFSIGNAEAVPNGWYQVTIQQAGSSTTYYYVALSDAAATPVFTNENFFFDTPRGKEILATALTCVSNGGNAWALLNGSTVFALFTR